MILLGLGQLFWNKLRLKRKVVVLWHPQCWLLRYQLVVHRHFWVRSIAFAVAVLLSVRDNSMISFLKCTWLVTKYVVVGRLTTIKDALSVKLHIESWRLVVQPLLQHASQFVILLSLVSHHDQVLLKFLFLLQHFLVHPHQFILKLRLHTLQQLSWQLRLLQLICCKLLIGLLLIDLLRCRGTFKGLLSEMMGWRCSLQRHLGCTLECGLFAVRSYRVLFWNIRRRSLRGLTTSHDDFGLRSFHNFANPDIFSPSRFLVFLLALQLLLSI